jgi:hypothetical protein
MEKFVLLLAKPPTVTTTGTFPDPRLNGTEAETPVLLQLTMGAVTPPMVTVLLPWLAPKLVPLMAITVPTGPETGAMLVIPGVTLKLPLLLGDPFTVTTIGALPVTRVSGTGTTMLVLPQLVGEASTPPIAIVLDPWVPLKLFPVTVMNAPTGACPGDTLLSVGGGLTINVTPADA